MPPVNRNKPVRAKSSESQYSLMEFMAEFPTDAACLEWLWRNRYSVDGIHATCPKCAERTEFARYETSQQRQSCPAVLRMRRMPCASGVDSSSSDDGKTVRPTRPTKLRAWGRRQS